VEGQYFCMRLFRSLRELLAIRVLMKHVRLLPSKDEITQMAEHAMLPVRTICTSDRLFDSRFGRVVCQSIRSKGYFGNVYMCQLLKMGIVVVLSGPNQRLTLPLNDPTPPKCTIFAYRIKQTSPSSLPAHPS